MKSVIKSLIQIIWLLFISIPIAVLVLLFVELFSLTIWLIKSLNKKLTKIKCYFVK